METKEKTEGELVHGIFKVEGVGHTGTLETLCVTCRVRLRGVSRGAAIPLLRQRISADYGSSTTVTFMFWCDRPVVRHTFL